MRNFLRVIRLALKHRWTLIGALICALGVGALWGANIGVVYPLVEITFGEKSLQDRLAEKLSRAERTAQDLRTQVRELENRLQLATSEGSATDAEAIRRKLFQIQTQLEAEEYAARTYRWAMPLVETYVPEDRLQTLVLILVVLMLGTGLKSFFLVSQNILASRFAQLAAYDLRQRLFAHALRMDLAAFHRDGMSQLLSRSTHDLAAISAGLEWLVGRLAREPLKMIACLVGAMWVSWRLLLVSLFITPVAGFLIYSLGRLLKAAHRRGMEKMAELYAGLEAALRGIAIVKAFTMEKHEEKRFHRTSKQYFATAMRIARYDAFVHPSTELLGMGTIVLALLAGGWLVLRGETHLLGIPITDRPLDLASLALFYGLLIGAADPLRKLSDLFGQLQRAAAASDRVLQLLDQQPQVRDPIRPRKILRHHREITFEKVSFAYHPEKLVLKEIELQIPFGTTLAIVGPSGCGKSTLVSLIPRFIDPTAGRVLLDGVPLTEVRLRDLRRQIGLVTQEPVLFDDTVFNNIRYGSLRATPAEVEQAARKAQAHEFIIRDLPEGYQTRVGPMGARLSGGQRQRIALARAILRNPAILILDEATSQLDLESERLIHKVLEDFIPGRTTIIISHRLSTLTLADQIAVMEDGQLMDVGSQQELVRRCPLFQRLCELDLAA